MRPGPELTTSVRLPVVVFPTERHAVEICALLLPEVTRPGGAGLQTEETLCDDRVFQKIQTSQSPETSDRIA